MASPRLGMCNSVIVVRSVYDAFCYYYRVPMGKPIGYQIGHRYATCTCVTTRYDVRQWHSRVAMTYLVA
jgi:hypothetical protein